MLSYYLTAKDKWGEDSPFYTPVTFSAAMETLEPVNDRVLGRADLFGELQIRSVGAEGVGRTVIVHDQTGSTFDDEQAEYQDRRPLSESHFD